MTHTQGTAATSSPRRRLAKSPRRSGGRAKGKLGKLLHARRKAIGMTQRELGVALGTKKKPVPLATISRWERGGTIEHPGMLFLALDALERQKHNGATGAEGG